MHRKHSHVATLYAFLAAGSDYTFDGNGELVSDIDGALVLMYQRNLIFYMDRFVFVSDRNTGHNCLIGVERLRQPIKQAMRAHGKLNQKKPNN